MKKGIKSILTASLVATTASLLPAEQLFLEKDSLKFGFIKLTDCAPIVIAKEKGFFGGVGGHLEVSAQLTR